MIVETTINVCGIDFECRAGVTVGHWDSNPAEPPEGSCVEWIQVSIHGEWVDFCEDDLADPDSVRNAILEAAGVTS